MVQTPHFEMCQRYFGTVNFKSDNGHWIPKNIPKNFCTRKVSLLLYNKPWKLTIF